MSDTIKNTISEAYNNFIMRDFTYISSGLLIMISIVYSFDLYPDITNIPNNNILMIFSLIIILIIAYFFGFIAQEIFRILHIVKTSSKVPNIYEEKYKSKNNIILIADIDRYFGIPTVKRLERLIFIKQIGSAFGSSFIFISIFIIIHIIKSCSCSCFDIGLLIFIIILAVFCIIENHSKWERHNEALNELANRIDLYIVIENIIELINKNSKSKLAESEEFKNFKKYFCNE